MTSQIRQNFHHDCEAAINRQINLELYASYVYLSMVRNVSESVVSCITALCYFKGIKKSVLIICLFIFVYSPDFQAYYFERDDKCLPNFAKFFHNQSKEEVVHAEKLMTFQNKRGGKIFLQDIRVCKDIFTNELKKKAKFMSFYIKKQNSLFINQGFTMFFNNKNGWTAVLQVALI